jgi:hypothetical protein
MLVVLPAPFGAEHGDDLAVRDREADPLQRLDTAVGLVNVGQLDGPAPGKP